MRTLFRFCFPSGPAAVSVVYRSPQEKNWYCVAICWLNYFISLQTSKCIKILLSALILWFFKVFNLIFYILIHLWLWRIKGVSLAAAILPEPATRCCGAVRDNSKCFKRIYQFNSMIYSCVLYLNKADR